MKKLLIVLDCEDYILEDLKKFDINEIELYPNTDTIHSYTWEDGFRLLEMPQYKKSLYLTDNKSIMINQPSIYESGWNDCLRQIIGEE